MSWDLKWTKATIGKEGSEWTVHRFSAKQGNLGRDLEFIPYISKDKKRGVLELEGPNRLEDVIKEVKKLEKQGNKPSDTFDKKTIEKRYSKDESLKTNEDDEKPFGKHKKALSDVKKADKDIVRINKELANLKKRMEVLKDKKHDIKGKSESLKKIPRISSLIEQALGEENPLQVTPFTLSDKELKDALQKEMEISDDDANKAIEDTKKLFN